MPEKKCGYCSMMIPEAPICCVHCGTKSDNITIDDNTPSAAEYWQQSKDALSNNELDKAAQLAFLSREKEVQSKGYQFSEIIPFFGNPLHAKKAASEVNKLEIPLTDVSQETKANLRTEVAFGILKGENARATERKTREVLKDDDFEWPEFDQWCSKFMSTNEWPIFWETIAAYHKIQAYPVDALLYELRKDQLLELAREYSVNARKSHNKEMIIRLLLNIISEQDRAKILALVNKLWKPRYLQEKRFFLTQMISSQAFHSAALNEFEAAERVIGEEVKVQWWTARDDRVCSICRYRHGKIYTQAEAQKIIAHPPKCFYCRCALLPFMESWAGLKGEIQKEEK
jgi:SPP1 gp7 family putative phage head morphogenesis protein